MKKGIVKWFNDAKGFGFLQDEKGKDYFVHFSSINVHGFKSLKEGQKVYFQDEVGPKGPCAKGVTLASDGFHDTSITDRAEDIFKG